MNVRVEAGPLTADAESTSVFLTVEHTSDVVLVAPVLTRFSLAPVVSVGGTSISSITPTKELIGDKAAS